MSVIVKGMEMPKNCAECRFWSVCECLSDFEDYVSVLEAVDDGDLVRDSDCPLIEIPTPHSDLVDRDDLIAEYDHQHKGPAGGARRIMVDAPTVIEAEGKGK